MHKDFMLTPDSDEDIEQLPEKQPRINLAHELIDWAEVIVTSIIVVVILFTFVFRVVGIDGPSMMNTLNSDYYTDPLNIGKNSDMVIISNFLYKPKIGDIVVISRNWDNNEQTVLNGSSKDQPIVKRIVAMEYDTVNIIDGYLYVNDVQQDLPRLAYDNIIKTVPEVSMPYFVPEGHVFVMGDNRNNSSDSRRMGALDKRYILGHVVLRIYPFNKFGSLSDA